jgi:hypothetical protein
MTQWTPKSRRSIPYFPSHERQHPSGGAFLFTRDLPLGITPLGSSFDRAHSIDLEPRDEETAQWLGQLLAIGHRGAHDFAGAVEGLVESIAQYLGYYGEVYFEIFLDGSPSSAPSESARALRLDALPHGYVQHVPGFYLQAVPRSDWQEIGKWAVAIPTKSIWHVGLPATYGRPREHRAMLRRLDKLWGSTPDFLLADGDLGRSAGYDMDAHQLACSIALERATNRWGTIPSLHQVKGTTEYFLIARGLQFQMSQAALREHIIDELNRLLQRIDPKGHRVVINGLPTSREIADALRSLHDGELSFAEAMKTTE